MIILSDESSLLSLAFEGQRYLDQESFLQAEEKDTSISLLAKEWLSLYFEGKEPSFSLPLSLSNLSPFRQKAYEILLRIPYGNVVTYKDVARVMEMETGKRVSCQAVGNAVSHNPVSIIIPCHRVIGSDSSLVGYAGGIERKKALLALEGVEMK